MTATRRDFLRALAAGTGLVMVPKALDRFRWRARPSGLLVGDWQTLDIRTLFGPGFVVGDPVSTSTGYLGTVTAVGPDSITIDWGLRG